MQSVWLTQCEKAIPFFSRGMDSSLFWLKTFELMQTGGSTPEFDSQSLIAKVWRPDSASDSEITAVKL